MTTAQPTGAATPALPAELVRASAGTGKTFALSTRLIRLLAMGQRPDGILATTFTRKAAGEILDRVLRRLADAADGREACAELAGHIEMPGFDRQQAGAALASLLGHIHRLSICTLDSFALRLAGAFDLELGLPPAWRIADDMTDRRLRNDAVRATLDADGDQQRHLLDLIRLLNPGEIRRSVHQQVLGVVSELHGLYRLQPDRDAWCWMSPPKPMEAAALQEAIEALGRLHDALPKTAKGEPDKRWVKAVAGDQDRAMKADWERFVTTGLPKAIVAGQEKFSGKPIPEEVAAAYQPLIDHAKAELLGYIAKSTRGMYELLQRYAPLLQEARRRAAALGFDDIKHQLAGGVAAGRLEEVYYRLDGAIDHLLLDEFQDTSLAEWVVLHPLAEELLSQEHEQRARSFFCVGDVKQAIYGWRGGVAELFDAVEQRWRQQLETRSEDQTRRCSPAVVEAVNAVFGSLDRNRPLADFPEAVTRWRERFNEHVSVFPEQPGHVELRAAAEAEEDEKEGDAGVRSAAELVRDLVGSMPEERTIGVLVRTNRAVARMIYELRRRDVAASEEGGNPPTDSPAVAVVLSLLRLAEHPGHTAAAYHVLRSPLGPIVGLRSMGREHLRRVAAAVRGRLLDEGYGPTIYGWVEQLAEQCDRRDLTRLLQLVELAHQFEPEATLRPGDFVRFVEHSRVADPAATAVRVMTVHQAKGLEFDAVVLPELQAELGLDPRSLVLTERRTPIELPTRISRYASQAVRPFSEDLQRMHEREEAAAVSESLCVLYVAMTRARHALYLIVPPTDKTGEDLRSTFAGLLCDALAPDRPASADTTLYETGDAQWFDRIESLKPAPEPSVSDGDVGSPAPPPVPKLARSSRRSRSLLRRSPSGLVGGSRVDLSRVMQLETGGRGFGSAIHAMFEQVEWLDEGAPDDRTLLDAAVAAGVHRPNPRADLDAFRGMIAQEPIRDALCRSRYPADAEIAAYREHPFAVRLDDRLFTGSFDRLVLIREGESLRVEVIDFKTDRVDGDPAEAVDELAEHYRPQVEAYRRAAARLFDLPPERIAARLLFVNPGLVRDL